ncbi:Crp/Fnr family transcriptional regulator [Piscinibacter aquaticus]|uniref:Crp/Fnr family transcriptional regulator n=1 Tax=Piscinibacter aquaticus TaxID=392597 RepID=A0A5C6TQ41_9BURK|nr:Crp/Fnr family transcriptional regulator [Piscinibacter aquaticus]
MISVVPAYWDADDMGNIAVSSLTKLGLSVSEALLIGRDLSPMSCLEGEQFLVRGDRLDYWVFVISGCLVGTVALDDGTQFPVAVYSEDNWFGEDLLLAKEPSSMTLTAVSDTYILLLPRKAFISALDTSRHFARILTKLLGTKSTGAFSQLVAMRYSSLPLKAFTLLALLVEAQVKRTGWKRSGRFPDEVIIRASQDLLGRLCGVSRTVFSSYLRVLRSRELVSVNYGILRVHKVVVFLSFLQEQRTRAYLPAKTSIEALVEALVESDVAWASVSNSFHPSTVPPEL